MAEILEGELRCQRHADGRVEILQAPPVTWLSLELLAHSDPVVMRVSGNHISIAGQVAYRVVGWDALQSALRLERDGGPPEQSPPAVFPPGAGTKGV
jgi:hypothetical protein